MNTSAAPNANVTQRNLVEILAREACFDKFLELLRTVGIEPMLRSAGPYTVFAPTDFAFTAMGPTAFEALVRDEARLRSVIQYHVLRGALRSSDLRHGGAKTLEGTLLQIGATDDGFTVDHANVTRTDLLCSNGLVHAIDAVIMPGYRPALAPTALEDSPWSGRRRVRGPSTAASAEDTKRL